MLCPPELYEEIKDEIPDHIGVFIGNGNFAFCAKKARRQNLEIEDNILKISMIRSMNRDVEKNIISGDKNIIGNYEKEIEKLRNDKYRKQESYMKICSENISLQSRIKELENLFVVLKKEVKGT
jgi:predicted transcriptional regulator